MHSLDLFVTVFATKQAQVPWGENDARLTLCVWTWCHRMLLRVILWDFQFQF
jgi:hypothetical protein